MTAHRFCCPYFHIPQGRGSVRGKPLRVSPLAFSHPPAGDHFCTAKVPHQKRRDTRTCVSSFLVRAMGLEPTRPYGHKHLKLACLPIPASPQISLFIIAEIFTLVKHKNLQLKNFFNNVNSQSKFHSGTYFGNLRSDSNFCCSNSKSIK